MQEPRWIPKESVIALHDRQLSEHGGLSGLRDEGLLESALARPQNLFLYSSDTVDVAAMAASYAYGLATNHPFLDGNKRAALMISFAFVEKNRKMVTADEMDAYQAIYDVAAGKLSEDDLAAWFRANMKDL